MVSITQDSETALEAILGFNPSPEFFDSVPDETIRELALLCVAPSDKPTSERISDFRSGVGTALLMSTGELSPELVLIADIVAGLAAAGSLRTFTEAHIPDIVDALTGIAWDEEDAGQIKAYHAYDGEIVLVCIKCKERYYNAQEFFNEDDLSSLQEIDTKEEKQS